MLCRRTAATTNDCGAAPAGELLSYPAEINPFSISDMPQDPNTPSAKPSNNEYLQPFIVASLAAIFGFGCIYYYRSDVTRALTVGGIAFLVLFWVVLRGNNLKKQRESNASPPASSKASKGASLWPGVAVACLLVSGLSIACYYTVTNALEDRAKTNRLLKSKQDDAVKRVRKIELIFWRELPNPNQSLDERVDEAAATLTIPVHSIEKNWPSGPIVVTYEGTARDAFAIQEAIRWKVGVPTDGYRFVE